MADEHEFDWKSLGYVPNERDEISQAPNGKPLDRFIARGLDGRKVTIYHSHKLR